MKIPKLRFNRSNGQPFTDWKLTCLSKISEINPKSPVLPNKFIYIDLESVKQGQLVLKKEFDLLEAPGRAQRMLKENDILFQMVRPYQQNNLLFKQSGDYVASTGYVQIRTKEDSSFIFQALHTQKFLKEVLRKCTGMGYPSIDSSSLANISFLAPEKDEQIQISRFLSLIDGRVNTLQRKNELLKAYKNAVMIKIFSQKIRFTDNGKKFQEWKEVMLSELLSEAKVRNYENKYSKNQVLSVSGEHGIVNQVKHLGRSYAGASISNYHIVETGDIVYTKSPLKEYPYGIIKVNSGEPGVVSTLYATYKVKPNISGSLIDYYFQSTIKINNYLHPLVKIGAKNDMKVNNGHVLTGKIFFPTSYEEQIKITDFLSAIDEKISNVQKQLELTKQYKQGLLQQMFV
jgi:type I restriction enzyme S subunit